MRGKPGSNSLASSLAEYKKMRGVASAGSEEVAHLDAPPRGADHLPVALALIGEGDVKPEQVGPNPGELLRVGDWLAGRRDKNGGLGLGGLGDRDGLSPRKQMD